MLSQRDDIIILFLEEEDPEKEDKLKKLDDKGKTKGHGSKELRHGPTSKFQQNKK